MSLPSSISSLTDLGLTENEAKVYVHALALGPTTALAIARRAAMYRPTVYAALDTLAQKGLMHDEVHGLKTKYVASDPANLEILLEKTRSEFRRTLPELQALYTKRGEDETIAYYDGSASVQQMYTALVQGLTHKDYYYVISDEERWMQSDPVFFERIAKEVSARRLDFRLILQDSERARYLKQYEANFGMRVQIVPKEKDFVMSMVVTPRHVFMHALTEPASAICIQSRRAIEMQRQVFLLMWEALDSESRRNV